MPLQQRRFLIAVAVVVVMGGVIGWTWCDWAHLVGLGQGAGSPSSSVSAADAADRLPATLPITPGEWQWQRAGDTSTAQFAGALVTVSCTVPARMVAIRRRAESAAGAAQSAAMTILTSTQSRTLQGRKLGDEIVVTLAADDPLLDALAVSRGRFGLEAAGLAGVYPGSWAEVSRVIEDCRAPPAR